MDRDTLSNGVGVAVAHQRVDKPVAATVVEVSLGPTEPEQVVTVVFQL
jgi:hypothetical protein